MTSRDGKSKDLTLFGGELGWHDSDWTDSDDRVRGGQSQSYLECTDDIGRFHGTLDIETLGGAGFASQRTTGEDREWDLSKYAGIQLCIAKGDKKRYTFNLKDSLLPRDSDTGREQSSISYECDFELPPQTRPGHAYERNVFIPWRSLTPTYRGKPRKDAPPLDRTKVKRMSVMMRSFFGAQEGDFSLSIRSICALREVPSKSYSTASDIEDLEKNPVKLETREISPPWNANAGIEEIRRAVNDDIRLQRRIMVVVALSVSLFAAYCVAKRFACV